MRALLSKGHVSSRKNERIAEAFRVSAREPAGTVIVLHEVWGFNSHIQEVCRDLSKVGFTAIAPLLYRREKALFDSARIREAMEVVWGLELEDRYDQDKLGSAIEKKRAPEETARLLRTLYDRAFRRRMLDEAVGVAEAAVREQSKVAALGFSMGGAFAFRLAAEFKELQACVAFSAEPPDAKDLRRISSPILAFYGDEDDFMTGRVPEFVRHALTYGKQLTLKTYPSAGHEFFARSDRSGYNEPAATDAWESTVAFLDRAFTRR